MCKVWARKCWVLKCESHWRQDSAVLEISRRNSVFVPWFCLRYMYEWHFNSVTLFFALLHQSVYADDILLISLFYLGMHWSTCFIYLSNKGPFGRLQVSYSEQRATFTKNELILNRRSNVNRSSKIYVELTV